MGRQSIKKTHSFDSVESEASMVQQDTWCHMLDTLTSSGGIEVEGIKKKSAALEEDDESAAMSPFLAYARDGYRWPDLYTEIDEMLEACILVYPMAALRKKARNDELPRFKRNILKTPLTHSEVMEVVQANKNHLTGTSFAKEFYVQILAAAEERNMLPKKGKQHVNPSSIIAFDDEFQEEELVYMIEVNHVRQRVTVCFRGTVTKTDWATDFEIYMKELPNPIVENARLKEAQKESAANPSVKTSRQKETLRVHNGFWNYLCKPSSRGAKGPHGEDLSEYQEIMYLHVLPVLKQFPDYKLYVTGHSLGAALATLFGFLAAAEHDEYIPKPVSVFSVAAPYVGDESFRAAHQTLESQGKLRHLRLANHKDIVTIIPKIAFRWNVFDGSAHVGALFKHVGMNIRMFGGVTPFEVSYPMVRTGYFSSTMDELSRGWDQTLFSNWLWNPKNYVTWPQHSLREYNKRAAANRPALQSVQLNDLYTRKSIVGSLVAEF